jgi:hypothetical protein
MGGSAFGESSDEPVVRRSEDFEYDEAHDISAAEMRYRSPAQHRVELPPDVNRDSGGDYGYDEAHDFGAS